MSPPLGQHWVFDAVGCPADRLHEPALVEALEGLPPLLALRKVTRAHSFAQQDGAQRSAAGIILLAESHLSLHAFPERGVLHGDLFSCKAFDLQLARAYLRRHFGAESLREQLLERTAEAAGPRSRTGT